jgi:hypothetical protein
VCLWWHLTPVVALKKSTSDGSVLIRYNSTSNVQDELLLKFGKMPPLSQAVMVFVADASIVETVLESRSFIETLTAILEKPTAVSSLGDGRVSIPARGSGRQANDAVVTTVVDNRGVHRISMDTVGFVGIVSLEVTAPLSVDVAGSDSYVVYAVVTHVTMLGSTEEVPWIVYHRYSDFETLDAELRRRVTASDSSMVVLLPTMPAKPWVPIGQVIAKGVYSNIA